MTPIAKDNEKTTRKDLLAAYANVYNNLDNLCWNIPTRVYAANFAIIAFLSSIKEPSPIAITCVFLGLFAVGFVNLVGASSLKRLWLDHTRMGYKIKKIDIANGYFIDRHSHSGANWDEWQSGQFLRKISFLDCVKMSVEISARQRNVYLMQIFGWNFIAVAIIIIIAAPISWYIFERDWMHIYRIAYSHENKSSVQAECRGHCQLSVPPTANK